MKRNQKDKQPRQPDRHLDIPAEANRDKHINFEKIEEGDDPIVQFKNKDDFKDRQERWQQGIEEGEKENKNSLHRK